MKSTLLDQTDYDSFRQKFPRLWLFKIFPKLEKFYYKKLYAYLYLFLCCFFGLFTLSIFILQFFNISFKDQL